MAVDKGGAVVDRMEPGEIDHGQHDAVRDVFLAPGGCTLVRSDLFTELGGFDPEIFAMGEDLDLCWRAQVLGARVVVAPGARVRHLERLAGGERAVPPDVAPDMSRRTSARGADDGGQRATLQAMQRRHELYAALKCYGPFHLVRVLPQVAVLAMAEMFVAAVAGHRERAGAVAQAWRWNLAHRRVLRAARATIRAQRRIDDRTVRRMQLRGSARLTAYVRRAFTLGLRAANLGGDEEEDAVDDPTGEEQATLSGAPAHGGLIRGRVSGHLGRGLGGQRAAWARPPPRWIVWLSSLRSSWCWARAS